MRPVVVVALVGVLAAGIVASVRIVRIGPNDRTEGHPYVIDLPDPDSRLARFLASGDGQFYVALALDPSLHRPQVFSSRGEAAYRAQRPLLPFLVRAVSLGRPGAIGPALVVLSVLAAGFGAGACALLAERRFGSPLAGIAVLLTPGAIAVLGGLGSELLALGLVALALIKWQDGRVWPASALFVLAAFARETTLVVPATLGVVELMRAQRLHRLAAVSVPVVLWGSWIAWVRLRVGVLPSSQGRLAAPFTGLVRAFPHWENTRANLFALAIGVAIIVGLALRRRSDLLAVVALANIALAVVAGPDVWHAWENFTRPLLPLYALGIVALFTQAWDLRADFPSDTCTMP